MINSIEKSVAEFIGTFALVLVAAGSVNVNWSFLGSHEILGVATACGLIVTLAVYSIGNISGAHINPAVTTSLFITGQMELKNTISYIVAQLMGATGACLFLSYLVPADMGNMYLGTTVLASEVTFKAGILIEAVLTFILVFTIFVVAVDNRTSTKYAGVIIGAIVFLDIIVAGSLTGASMNPARTFGPAFVLGHWADHLVYWIGPITGGMFAAFFYTGIFSLKGNTA
ncbi:aquaporin [Methanococcoides methylutens]|uniref:Aquaporin Z n=1 Tax=Methanococcoides methylutens MM1 TaxID=1434104 RepID=A0A0E3X0G1_METMT|nr:aquaporin [Methanococcoides methylutens]AKB85669.1 Aquaporin Z [Methanococcoides methylutens MM1]